MVRTFVMGAPQAPFAKTLEVLATHRALDGDRLAPDVVLVSIGDHFDYDLNDPDTAGEEHGNRRTWAWPVGSITLSFQLDHILHDAHFVPVTAAIVEAGRSDHKPIWADFERIDP